RPDIPGLAEAGFLTNESVFTLTELPRRLAVIGAGAIGCERAPGFAPFGSQGSLIGRAPQGLAREGEGAAPRPEGVLRRDGVRLVLGTEPARVERRPDGKAVFLKGQDEPIVVDEILVGAGRQPNVEGLNLEAAGVAYDPHKGVTVDDRLRTTNPRIFAAGDVCSRYQFTHAADA